jgi:hypothetical protein
MADTDSYGIVLFKRFNMQMSMNVCVELYLLL